MKTRIVTIVSIILLVLAGIFSTGYAHAHMMDTTSVNTSYVSDTSTEPPSDSSTIFVSDTPSDSITPDIRNTSYVTISPEPSGSSTTQQAIEFRLNLRSLLQEHAVLAADTLTSRYDDRPDFSVAQSMLDQNGQQIADEIEKTYGSDVKNQFLSLWQEHNQLYVNYTDGLKDNDSHQKDDAKAALDTWITNMTSLFVDHVQGTTNEQLTNLFRDHVYFTRLVIESHASGDYQTEFQYKHTGFEHMAAMADILSGMPWNY